MPQQQGRQVQDALEGFAAGSIQELLNLESQSLIQSIELKELADVFIVGQMSINLRDSDIQGAIAADTVTRLQLLRVAPEANRIQVYTLPGLIERGIHRQVDRAIQFAVSDTAESAQPLLEQLERWTGPPNRLVVVYVEGLPSLFVYEDFQEQLRQYSALGVEEVRGVTFAQDVSQVIVTLSEQSLIHGNLAKQVEYLATALDEKPDYAVKKRGTRTMFLQYVPGQ